MQELLTGLLIAAPLVMISYAFNFLLEWNHPARKWILTLIMLFIFGAVSYSIWFVISNDPGPQTSSGLQNP